MVGEIKKVNIKLTKAARRKRENGKKAWSGTGERENEKRGRGCIINITPNER